MALCVTTTTRQTQVESATHGSERELEEDHGNRKDFERTARKDRERSDEKHERTKTGMI